LRPRRAPRAARTSGTRPIRKATKPTKKGRKRPAAATPAPVAQPTQPAAQPAVQQAPQPAQQPTDQTEQQQSPDNVEPEADEEPADDQPAPADETATNDPTAEQEAEIEAAKVQESLLEASAAQDRAEKQKAADKKQREAADKEAAKKRKEAKEQAERDEAARIEQEEADRKEADRKEAAEKLKAAQKRKDAEEAARKQAEEAARERVVQQQKIAEETARQKAAEEKKLGEEKKAAEEAARQKAAQEKAADEERLAQEKIAAEAKAAQEKEQAAAKAKAAQDEAAKMKAAAQKKADDDVAAFKRAEEEAKVEKIRQAKEQKEKAAQELREKEERGLKRPGVKRAAPQTDDQANKKAKTDDYKPSCTDFEKGLTFAKFKFGDSKSPKTPEGPVKFGSHLNLDTIFQALASVTEAINDACVKDSQGKIWGLFHPRSLVDFDIVDHPVVLHRHEALVPIQRRAGKKTHFSLIALVQTEVASRHGRDYFAIHHYDCDPSLRSAFINTIAKTTVRSQILAAGWAGSNKGDIETPLGKSENADCCDRLPGAEQEWTTGIHAVLNGWVCALKLKHNKNALLSKEDFYEKAVDLINLAIRKHITSKTILNFFDCYEYVEKDDLPEEDRKRRTFAETKDFETYARLDKYILALLGRKPRVDVDEISGTGPRTERTPVTEKPLGSGRPTGDYAPSILDAFLKGADGPARIPKDEKETDDAEEPKQGPVDDDGYDSARSNNDEDEIDDIDDVDEEGNAVLEEDIVVEEPKQLFDWRGKAITEETRKAQAAARAAAKEKLAQAKREREEKEASEAAGRARAAKPDDTDKSLFGEDNDEDMGDFYNNDEPPRNDQPAPTSAPLDVNAQIDSDEDLYGSSRSPQRQTQPQPTLQPTVVDEDEEDLYTASPPRNRNPPPAAASAFNLNLNLPRPPPPTPHDPYAVNGNPFLFPTMYDQVPQPPTKPSFNLVVENGPVLPPPVPPPASSNTVPASTRAPRRFTKPNSQGTFTVPDLPSDSDENPHDNATGTQNGSAQPKTTLPKPAQTNGAATNPKPTTTPPQPKSIPTAPAPPTSAADDDEAAWEAAGFIRRAQSPSLEAAMAEYDDDADVDANQLEDPNEYLPDEPTREDHDGAEPTQIQSGDDDELEPDPEVVVRHGVGDDVQYGDVAVEVEEVEKEEDRGNEKEDEETYEADYEYREEDEQWKEKEEGEEGDEVDYDYDHVDDEGDV
jgi:hypothetical protein